MPSRDVNNLLAEGLRIVARAGVKAAARGAESVLSDARAGVGVIGKRLDRAVSRAQAMQRAFDDDYYKDE